MKRFLISVMILIAWGCTGAQNKKVSEMTAATSAADADLFYMVASPYGSTSDRKITFGNFKIALTTSGFLTSSNFLTSSIYSKLLKTDEQAFITTLYQFTNSTGGILFGSNNALQLPLLSDTTITFLPGTIYRIASGGDVYLGYAKKLSTSYTGTVDRIVTVDYLQENGYSDSAAAIGPNTVGSSQIITGTIKNEDISSAAGIAWSKMAGVSAGKIIVGDASGIGQIVQPSGDISLTDDGEFRIKSTTTKSTVVKISSQIYYPKQWNGNDIISQFYIQQYLNTVDTLDFEMPVPISGFNSATILDSVKFQISGSGNIDSCQIVSIDYGVQTKRDQADNSVLLIGGQQTANYAFNYQFQDADARAYYLKVYLSKDNVLDNCFIYNIAFYYKSMGGN